MKAFIIYFSGTGNTKRVAQYLQEAFVAIGHEAEDYSIENETLQDPKVLEANIQDADIVLMGYPIYGSKAPRLMEAFIEGLPIVHQPKAIGIFTTVALASGDGPVYLRKKLEAKGYDFVYAREFIMNNNFNVPGFPDVLKPGSPEKIAKRCEKSRLKAVKMVSDIVAGKEKRQGSNIGAHLLGVTQRAHVDDLIQKITGTLMADDGRCVSCNLCVKSCPTKNIAWSDGKIAFGNQCMGCMRCYHICKVEAINITEATLDGKRWPRLRL